MSYNGHLDVSKIFSATIKGKSFNTVKAYKGGFKTWKSFALNNCLNVFPVNKVEFSIFLISKCELGASWPTLSKYINSVKFFHWLFRKNVCENGLVDSQIMHFLRKCSRKPDNKMRPLSKSEFDLIIQEHMSIHKSLLVLRSLCILIFGYIAFLRYDDVSQIKWSNVKIVNDKIFISLYDAKNDKYKKGQSVSFRLNKVLLKVFRNYLFFAKLWPLKHDKKVFLFFQVKKDKCDFYRKISYDEVRKLLLNMCVKAGVSMEKIGTHSLRIGGCTQASKCGVPDYVLDFYGRWSLNSTARARYQRVVGEEALIVSEILNC